MHMMKEEKDEGLACCRSKFESDRNGSECAVALPAGMPIRKWTSELR